MAAVQQAAPVQSAPTVAVAPADYACGKSWLCRPGRQDACAVDLATTIVAADGGLTREAWTADPNAPIDCFYVYPTVSTDATPNSDMTADPAERNVVGAQFARVASRCRPYAPLYRQVTLAALRRALTGGGPVSMDRGLGYDDVRDAWSYYLGDVGAGTPTAATSGLHLIDVGLGMGNLLDIVRQQARTYTGQRSGVAMDGAAIYKAQCAACHDSPLTRAPDRATLGLKSRDAILASLVSGTM